MKLSGARRLATQAHIVKRPPGEFWRALLRRISRGRLGKEHPWRGKPRLNTPWQDTNSTQRSTWRMRTANLAGKTAFEVDYQVCRRCRLGWVEQPFTLPPYQRCGLASAGLAQLRAEHPGLSWHTLGGHLNDSQPFWAVVAQDVPGGYQQRDVCPHVPRG